VLSDIIQLDLKSKIRPKLRKLFAFGLVFLLLFSHSISGRTSKTQPRGAAEPRPALHQPSKKKSSATRTRRGKRHRRLRISRSLKPMPALSEAPFSAEVPLLPLIEEAKSQLEKETARYFPGTRKSHPRREVKLALAHFKTGKLQIVSGTEQGGRLTLSDPKIRYEVDWWNGFNSSITIVDPSYSGVVAMLYGLEADRQRFLRQDAIIYTPYSSALLQTELVGAGRIYLMDKIRQARRELGQVESRAFPGMTLANSPGFSDEHYFNLILTEQMDPGRFRSIAAGVWELNDEQESQLQRLANRILVIIGANQEDAYSFTGNYASARGLTQFTPMGMSVVWSRYPNAGIPSDFRDATRSHLNAIKAEICLLDNDLAELSKCHPALIGSGLEMYAAGASYNGGPKRVRFGLENFGLAWFHPISRLTALESKGNTLSRAERQEYLWLKRNRSHETFVYLNKIHAIQRFQNKFSAGRDTTTSPTEAQ
jgi:hypothetical protein